MGKKIFIFLILSGLFFFREKLALAISAPSFPSCTFPTGTLKTHYDDGIHGIPGDMAVHQGRDDVYEVNDTLTYQCFCPPDSQGIQTNWWKISGLPQTDIDYLKHLGWIYIPDGSLWGLTGDPYMALSSAYDCSANIGVGGGEVLGTTVSLASTGNSAFAYSLAIFGSFFIILGFFLQKTKKNLK